MDTRSFATSEEIEGLRDAVALVIALRARNRAAAREILSLHQGTNSALIEALVGVIEAFGIDAAACHGLTFDELLRRLSLRLAMHPGTSSATPAGPS